MLKLPLLATIRKLAAALVGIPLAVSCGGQTSGSGPGLEPTNAGSLPTPSGTDGLQPGAPPVTTSPASNVSPYSIEDSEKCAKGPGVLCTTNQDCAGSEACLCRPVRESRCVQAECRGHSDCKEGKCIETVLREDCTNPAVTVAYFCSTAEDECDPMKPAATGCRELEACRYSLPSRAFRCHSFCNL